METPEKLWDVFQEGHEDTVHDSDSTQAGLTNYTLHWVVRFLKEILKELRGHSPVESDAAQDLDLAPPRTVLVVGPDVDLEPGDLGEDTDA